MKNKESHEHISPTFGCTECIKADKQAFLLRAFEAWSKTYKYPKCGYCGGKTKAWERDLNSHGQVAVIVGCESDGDRGCGDADYEVII